MSESDPPMSESNPLTDKYPDHVLKIAVEELVEEKRANGKVHKDSYKESASVTQEDWVRSDPGCFI